MDSVHGACRLACQTPNKLSCTTCIYLRATREKMASPFASVTSEEIIQIKFCGAYYLTVLVHVYKCTTATIHPDFGA